jgi:hypothetical protein
MRRQARPLHRGESEWLVRDSSRLDDYAPAPGLSWMVPLLNRLHRKSRSVDRAGLLEKAMSVPHMSIKQPKAGSDRNN